MRDIAYLYFRNFFHPEMAGNDRKWAELGGNGWKWVEMSGNEWKWVVRTGNSRKMPQKLQKKTKNISNK